jgi:hypothetical protein
MCKTAYGRVTEILNQHQQEGQSKVFQTLQISKSGNPYIILHNISIL